MLYILDRSEKVVGLLHSGTDRGSANVYFDDLHTEDLSTGAETLSFSSIVDRKTSSYLSVGSYIAFKKNNAFRMMQIIETEEEKEDVLVKNVYCETIGLELRNSVYSGSSMPNVNIKRFLDNVLQNTYWKVGYIDSSLTDSLAIEAESKEVYNLIQEHSSSFGAEIRFRVEIKNNIVVGRYVDAFAQRGRRDGKRLEIHRDISKIVRKIDLSNYATKLIGVGKDGLSFRDIADDSLNKPLGQDFITNEEAFKQINYKGEHITRKFEYDTFDAYDLLRQTKKALDEMSKPQITYEIDANLINFDDIEIGDSLVVSDMSFEPPLTLVARISVLETSNSDITKNKATLTNFKKVASGLSMLPIGGNDIINGAIGGDHIGQGQINNGHINDVSADKLTAGRIDAQIIDVVNLNASNITSGTINAGQIDVINLNADHINSGTIDAQKIDVVNLNADNIVTGKLHGDLITANTIGAEHIIAGSISAGSQIVANGAIGSAQISSLSADKLDAGTIDTAKISVAGANNHLWLRGNRIQVFEGTGTQAKERVSMGDVNGDGTKYGLRVRGADGQTILLDENGVTSEGITNGAITDDKVAGNANIHGTKLDIDSVIVNINDNGTEVIKGTKIDIDGTNLGVKLTEITNQQNDHSQKINNNTASIQANENKINLKVDTQTYEQDKNDMTQIVNKNTADITLLNNQIALKVEATDIKNAINQYDNTVNTKINQAKAEIKVTTDGITQSVTNVQSQVNTANGNISNLQTQTSQIQQTANKIHWLVKDGTNQANMQLTSNGLNVIADAINLDGLVKFTNLSTQGQTTINGGNITTGTIDTNRVNIKGSTTKKIVVGNDNYTVYDGAETDTNRKIFMGFRTNTAINVPSVMLGYNGINPSVDGAVISGGTYTTYSHYPNNNNPEAVNLSYGALAFKYGAGTNQFSTLNMYQDGSVDVKGGNRISFRPNLRDRSNPTFYIDDVETMSRVPLKCTQSIYANGEITTDTNITCRDLLLFNRIKNISNSFYVSNAGAVGTASINNDGVLTQEGIGHFYSGIQGWNGIGSSSNTWTITQGGHAFFTGVNYFYNSNNISNLINTQDALDVIDSVEVVDTNEGYRLTKNPKSKDVKITRCVTLDDEDNVTIDLTESISVLWKAVQELKQENLELKKRIETLERP